MKQILFAAAISFCWLNIAGVSIVSSQSRKTDNVYRLDDSSNRPAATISQMEWLAGSWVGEGLGGRVEETWNSPSAGTMIGTFKLVHGDEPSIYEIELIEEEEGSLVWKVKHFNPDFSAWEDKEDYVSFPLVKIEPGTAYFDGMTVKKEGEDGMTIFLAMSHDGAISEEILKFDRIRWNIHQNDNKD